MGLFDIFSTHAKGKLQKPNANSMDPEIQPFAEWTLNRESTSLVSKHPMEVIVNCDGQVS